MSNRKKARIATQVILVMLFTLGAGLFLSYLYQRSIEAVETSTVVKRDASATTAAAGQRKIARAGNGDLYAVYTRSDGTNQQIYFAKSTDNGATWAAESKVHTDVLAEQKEPAIAIDSSDNLYVAWTGKGWGVTGTVNFNVQYRKYNKETSLWGTQESVTDIANDQLSPSLDIDSADNLYVAWTGKGWGVTGTANFNIQYRKYNKATSLWGTQESVTDIANDQFSPSLDIDSSNNAHVAWYGTGWGTNTANFNIQYRKKTATWQARESVTDIANDQLSPSLAIDSSNNAHVAWYGTNNIQYSKRTINSAGWPSTHESVTDKNNPQINPSLALDSAGNVYVAWTGKGWGTNTTVNNIQYSKRAFASADWSANQASVTDLATEQNYPALLWQKTNIITKGFSFIWTDSGGGIKFYASDGIIWPGVYFVLTASNPAPVVGSSPAITITASKKDASNADVTITNYNAATAVSVSAGGSATFTAPSSGNPISLKNTDWKSGAASVTITDDTAQSVTVKAIDQKNTSITGSTSVSFQPAAANKLILNQPADIDAGTRAAYMVTLADQYGNSANAGAGGKAVYLFTNSAGANAKFYNASSGGSAITSITIAQGSSLANFWYYDDTPGTDTITASDAQPANGATGLTDAQDTITVNPTEAQIEEGLNKKYKIKFGDDEAEIGDFRAKKFRPHVKMKRWGEECYLSIEFPDSKIPVKNKSVGVEAEKIKWKSPELEAHFYKKERGEISAKDNKGKSRSFLQNESGALEFELILAKKPDSNVFSLPIEAKGLKFYYQGPLTGEEIAQGAVRPNEAVGSYAVYHETKKDGKYATGKAFHIYRPKIIDAKGDEIWGELVIASPEGAKQSNGALTITIDRAWLDSAAYPVIVDPTFGYDTQGASSVSIANVIMGSAFTEGVSAETVTSITAYLANADAVASHAAKYAIYNTDSSLNNTTAEVTVPISSAGWYTGSFSSSVTLSASTEYILAAWGDNANTTIYYDTGVADQGHSQALTYGAWPGPAEFVHDTNKYSIYASQTTATFDITATLDEVLPSAPAIGTFTPTGGNVVSNYVNGTNTGFTVSFTSPAAEFAGTAHLYVGGVDFATPITTAVTLASTPGTLTGDATSITGLGADGAKALTVVIVDASGNVSAASSVVNITKDTVVPTISDGQWSSDNTYVDVTFAEGVYTAPAGSGALETTDLSFTFTQNTGIATNAVMNSVTKTTGAVLTGGESTIRVTMTVTGAPSGQEAIEIKPAAAGSIYDAAGNAASIATTTGAVHPSCVTFTITATLDTVIPNAPTGVSFAAAGGTVVSNTLNTTNTNFTASAAITAGDAAGGTAELLKGGASFSPAITDTSIAAEDTSVSFDAGLTTNAGVQSAFASGAAVSVKLSDAAGNSITSITANPTITVDYTAPANQDTVFSASVTKKGEAAVTIVSSGDATNNVWFAPAGTTTFTAGATMTTAGGTATSILSPAAEGAYKMFVIDAAGNYSSASTAILTVDATIPSGGSILYADGVTSSTSVVITLDAGTDSNGLASGKLLQRAAAAYTNGGVGAWSGFSTIATDPVSPYSDSTLIAGNAYKYQYVVSDNAGNLATYTSTNIVKVLGILNHYNISEPASAIAGANFSITVTPHDVYSNAVNGSATVTLSAETAAGVAGTGTLSSVIYPTLVVDTSAGAITITDLKYTKAESIKIKATDTVKSSTFADIANTVAVAPAAAASIAFTTQPSATATPGVEFGTQPVIKLYDTYSNLCTNDSATQVTLSPVLSSNNATAGSGTLGGTLTKTASSGIVTYSGLSYTIAESIDLKAVSGALPVIYSDAIDVTQSLSLSAPVGSENWAAGSSQTISWTDPKSLVSNVKLSYSTDGTNYNDVIIDSVSDTGTYSWTVPSFVSGTVKVKVEDAANAYSYDTSDANFNIVKPVFTLGAIPATINTGATQPVSWTLDGVINSDTHNLSLYYSRDNFASYYDMAGTASAKTSASSISPYSWTVSFDPGSSTVLKIEDAFYQLLKDTTDTHFNSGAYSSTAVSGTGNAAGVKLGTTGANAWTNLTNDTSVLPFTIYSGGALAYDGSGNLYALGGVNTKNFAKYNLATKIWTDLTNDTSVLPFTVWAGGALAYDGSGNLYVLGGGSVATKNFAKYNLATKIWTDLTNDTSVLPFTVYWDGALAYDGSGNLYALGGNSTKNFAKYNLATKIWTNLTNDTSVLPFTIYSGGALAYDGSGNLYALGGVNTKNFAKYNLATKIWTDLTNDTSVLPFTVWAGGALAYDGSGNLYVLGGGSVATKNFAKYNLATKIWTDLTNDTSVLPFTVYWDGALAYDGSGNLYALGGNSTKNFAKYNLATKIWTNLTNDTSVLPFTVIYGGALAYDGSGNLYALGGNSTKNFARYSMPYLSSGTFTSRAIDTLGNSEYGKLSWGADVPSQIINPYPDHITGSGELSSSISGLVGLWHMNSVTSGTTADASSNAYTATLGSSTVGDAAEPQLDTNNKKLGAGALSFNGTNYMRLAVPLPDNLRFNTGPFTLECWVKTSASSGTIMTTYAGDGYYAIDLSAGKPIFTVRQASSPNTFVYASSSVTVNDGNWHHIAGVRNGDNIYIYIDSVNRGSGSGVATFGTYNGLNQQTLFFGVTYYAWVPSFVSYFTGLIDEVAIYNRALTAAEILAHYQGTALKFQAAAMADTNANGLADDTWTGYYGPTGLTDYFTTSGTDIPVALDGKRWLKYKAYFATADTAYTPTLNDVTVSFVGTTASGNDKITATSNAFTIEPKTIVTADVQPASLVVGAMGNVTVSFTTINSLPATGKIVVTLPANFVINSGGTTAVTSENLQGSLAVGSVSGQVITLTRTSGVAETAGFAPNITLSYIKNPNDTGPTGTYSIKTTTSDNKTIDQKLDVSEDTIVNGGALTSTNVEPATRYAEVSENQAVSFTTTNPIPKDGKIIVTFPAGFVLDSGGLTAVSSISGIDGTLTVTTDVPNRVVTLTRGGAATQSAAGAKSFTLSNVKNPAAANLDASGTSGTYAIQTNTASSDTTTGKIDSGTASGDHIICSLASPTITPASYKAGATPNHTIAFTSVSQIPAGGKIEVDFPDGYDLSGTVAYVSGNASSTVSVSSQTLTITLGTAVNAATPVSIVVSGIKNPLFIGTTGTFNIRTKNASSVLIDEKTLIAGNDIVKPLLTITPDLPLNLYYTAANQNIAWTYDGENTNNLNNLGIYYTLDGTVGTPSWTLISSPVANIPSSFSWNIPNASSVGSKAQVKISDTFYQSLKDTTDAQFNSGAYSSTAVSGTGNSAGVKLGKGTTLTWTNLTNDTSVLPFNISWFGNLAYDGSGNLYALGGTGSSPSTGNFAKYNLATKTWTNLPVLPSFTVAAGLALTYDGTGNLYAVGGGGTKNFAKYNLTTSTWTDLTNDTSVLPFTIYYGGDLAYDGSGNLYALGGNSTKNFAKYNLATKTWTNLTNDSSVLPFNVMFVGGSALTYDGTGNLYAIGGNDTKNFAKYNLATKTWTNLTNDTSVLPFTIYNGALTYDGAGNLYALKGNSAYFAKYNLATKTWTSLGSTVPFIPYIGCDFVYDDSGNLYLLGGGTSLNKNFAKLSAPYLSSGTFTSRAIDTLGNSEYGKLSWSADTAGSTLGMEIPSTTSGLVGLWRMNGTVGAIVANGAAITATAGTSGTASNVNGTGMAYAAGKLNQAINFDGVDDTIRFTTNLGISGELTAEAWVYPTEGPTGLGRLVASTYYYNVNPALSRGWSFGVQYGSSDYFAFQVYSSSTNSVISKNNFFNDNLNKWTHVVGVYKPSEFVRLYVNGVLVGENTTNVINSIAYHPTTYLGIGERSDYAINGNAGFWKGLMDEVAIYNRALTAAEILAHYQGNAMTFQVAGGTDTNADNVPDQWTNFSGPTGLTDYFTTSGQSLAGTVPGVDGKRWLKYKAYLATVDTAYTPTLNDVTVSFVDNDGVNDKVTGLSNNFILVGPTTQYSLTNVVDMVAGTEATYTLTRKDVNAQEVKGAAETVTLSSTNSTTCQFRSVSGTAVAAGSANLTIPAGSSSITFYYYDTKMAAPTITALSNAAAVNGNSNSITTTDTLNVKHAAVEHLRFKTDITGPQKVDVTFQLPQVYAVDAYDNIATTDYGATAFAGAKILSYSLSTGLENAPDANAADYWTTNVDFTNGASVTALWTTLYRAQDMAITAKDITAGTTLSATANIASNIITVNPQTKLKLVFKQQASAIGTANVALTQQPIVAIRDTYGNQTADTDVIALSASSSNTAYASAPGALSAAVNPLPATAGQAEFGGVKYANLNKSEDIYLYAVSGTLNPVFSDKITFGVTSDSTVEAAAVPQANFDLVPTNDTIENKISVLKFRIKDTGIDAVPTLIDRAVVDVAGTGANAATDIAWAGLYVGETQVAEATGSAITNTSITFGAVPNNNSSAGVYAVTDNTSVEFTVYIYMKDGKLAAIDKQTYTFGINETGIGTDTNLSSQMAADSAKVATVTGTIKVDVTHLEITDAAGAIDAGAASLGLTAGQPVELVVRATDANKNIDKDYGATTHTLIFSGLNAIGSNNPKIESTNFTYNTPVSFPAIPGGVSNAGAVTLTAYKAESGAVSVSELGQTYQAHTLPITVAAASATNISLSSGNGQSGKISKALANPLIVITKDTYGNPVPDITVDFAISSVPASATGQILSTASAVTGANGLAQTALTLGNLSGTYQVTAASTPALTGSPVTFSATALLPSALTKVSGDSQSKQVTLALDNALTVKLADSANAGIPNETVTFNIISSPAEATGQALSVSSATTDSAGQASVILTLGDKTGDYVMQASSNSFTANFTATATALAPYKVVLSGPGSVAAGEVSTGFTVALKDSYDNLTNATALGTFNLATTSTTGGFYSDSLAATPITSITIASGASASASFYYKDTTAALPTASATRASGDTLTTGSSSLNVNIVPADLHHFTVTGSTAAIATGESKAITLKAYDSHNNLRTNFTGDMAITFSGAAASPSPSNKAATCSDKNNSEVALGSPTTIAFSAGTAACTLKVYKVESVLLKASAGSITTSDSQGLSFIVKHSAANHVKFASAIPVPGGGFKAGVNFPLPQVQVLDTYDNLCDNTNGGASYTESGKTVNYALSTGLNNAPDNSVNDIWINSVDFTAGVSDTPLTATLYYAQTASITPRIEGLAGTNIASASIAVAPGAVSKLWFSRQPSTGCVTNTALAQQPKVSVADQYGNAVTSTSDNVTIAASTTTGTYSAAVNGTLSGDALTVATVNGVSTFNGLKYSYPEIIYLRAVSANNADLSVYSSPVTFSVTSDGKLEAGALAEPAAISSLANSDAAKVQAFDFKITDIAGDGYDTKIKKIVIAKGASDTTNGWLDYVSGVTLSDGSLVRTGAITDSTIVFGSGDSTIYTVSEGLNKTFTLSIYLKAVLPEGADNKVIAFSVAPANITVESLGSQLDSSAAAVTTSPKVDVAVTKFVITASSAAVAAGPTGVTLTIKSTDTNKNVDLDYAGDKDLIFSGASAAISGGTTYNPTCTDYARADDAFGNVTPVSFISGESSSTITAKLYKAEAAHIKATAGSITTSDSDDADITVSGGTAYKLAWNTQPKNKVAANAPWNTFKIAVSDRYGNTASSSTAVKITPSGGVTSVGATDTVTAQSGIATFSNFSAYCAAYPGTVTLNAAASGVLESGSSDAVSVDEKYYITVKVLDSVNGSALTEIAFKVLDAVDSTKAPYYNESGNSPFSFYLPYGKYNFNFVKEAYVETTTEKVPDVSADALDGVYDNNISWTVYVMSVSESLADYRVRSNFIYTEPAYNSDGSLKANTDTLDVKLWLEKRGEQVVNTEIIKLGKAKIMVRDVSNLADTGTLITLADLADDYLLAKELRNGVYGITIPHITTSGTGKVLSLSGGKSYSAKCSITWAAGSGAITREDIVVFTVSFSERLQNITEAVQAVSSQIMGQTTAIQKTVKEEIEGTIKAVIEPKITEVKAETAKILTATETTIPDKMDVIKTAIVTEVQPHVKSGILNSETAVKQGAKITMRYRTDTLLAPSISVYSPKDALLISGEMVEVATAPGIYEYEFTFKDSWGTGDFTIVCSEATKGTVDAMVISVRTSDIEDVSGSVSAIMGSTSGLQGLKKVTDTLGAQFSDLDNVLAQISNNITGKMDEAKGAVSELSDVLNQLEEMSKQIKGLGGTEGINLEKLYEVSKDKKEDITYIKNKSEELKAAMELNQKMIENVARKPVVQSWFEFK